MKLQLVQFQDIVDFPPKISLKRGSDYSFIEMGDVNPDSRYVRNRIQKQYTASGSAKFEDKDILFARITPCLENGKIAQAILPQGKKGFGSTEFFVFRAKPDKIDQTFLYYLSKSDLLWKSAVNSMVGASGRQRADATFLKRLRFYIPAIGDQKKIAAILSAYDDLIENNNRRIAILEKMAEEIYKEWFVRMRFPGHEKTTFEKGIPKEWEVQKIGNLCFVGRGSSPRPINDKAYFENGSIPWIKIADATNSKMFILDTKDCVNEFGASFSRKLSAGDLIIATSGTLGFCIFLGVEGCIHDGWIYSSNYKKNIRPAFLFYVINDFRKHLNNLSYGAAIQNINTDIIRNLSVLVPSEELLDRFYISVQPIHKLLLNKILKSKTLKQTRDRLLTRLISGKLSVADLDIRFPRSMREESDAEFHL